MTDQPQQPAAADRQRAWIGSALHETMRELGIPSDWMECRSLRATNSRGVNGVHVQFFVKSDGQDLLARATVFEATFMRHLRRLDTTAKGWVFSMAWVLQPGSFPSSADDAWQLPMPEPRVDQRSHPRAFASPRR